MSELTFPFNASGKPVGAKFSDRGCLQCPTGTGFTPDDALNVLERVTNNILLQGWKKYRKPNFPLAAEPIREARWPQMSINSQIKYHAFFPQVQNTKFYDPMPSVQTYQVTRELINQCGGDVAMAQLIANMNNLGCAPPRGNRALTGKDRYFQSAATCVFDLGPFCITKYLDLADFQGQLDAIKDAASGAAGMALEYEKIRKFAEMSYNNASCVAGTRGPTFFKGVFGEMPTSPGSFDWILEAIDTGIGPELTSATKEVVVKSSKRLQQYWIQKFKKDHNIQLWETSGNVKSGVIGYMNQFTEEGGDFVLTSLRTNRRVRFTTDVEPVYIQLMATGLDAAQWDFQDYYNIQLGDDPSTDQANGYRQRVNPAYGDPSVWCDGEKKILAEPVFIYTADAFHYEAFPTNPLGASINKEVETNLQRLWGGTEVIWRFGADVELYDLAIVNRDLAQYGFPCVNNRDKTWFAGNVKAGCQFVEDDPRQMMMLMFAVPANNYTVEACDACLPCQPPTPINITPKPNDAQPKLCVPVPGGDVPTDPPGCIMPPGQLQYVLPAVDSRNSVIKVRRVGGTNGSLTVNFASVNGTAVKGTHFTLTNGALVFADGEDYKEITIGLLPVLRPVGGPNIVQFTLNWTASGGVICEDAVTSTPVCLVLGCISSQAAACAEPSCTNCPPS